MGDPENDLLTDAVVTSTWSDPLVSGSQPLAMLLRSAAEKALAFLLPFDVFAVAAAATALRMLPELEMPLDIPIFSRLQPLDVLHLARKMKDLSNVDPAEADMVWMTRPSGLNEPQHANLAFLPHCHVFQCRFAAGEHSILPDIETFQFNNQ
ncbi:hypothetical protein B0H17DRAFT_1324474 [Mycena rosella]|uniref:F-box domain-containing protein n=1 Tax=Mycena rosella TaxID=1033263 RepID=A0AAD7MBN9_MYCRO|nr:hypothetical protein B0H17DRAFT_1324474 [Mycena rosella]